MKDRLYFDDPYRTSFASQVVERLETPDGPAVVLTATYFYPESGGQPCDLGAVDGIPILKIYEDGGRVVHVLERLPSSDRVSCQIDGDRRRDHMQQHTGQHILSAAFMKVAGAQTRSFHLGGGTSTIDLDESDLTPGAVEAAEDLANRVVRESAPVRSYFVTPEQAQKLELRKTPEAEGILRIVEVEGIDRQACCGTHPKSAAEVGPILVRGLERFKGGTRVEFVCGERALRDYRVTVLRIRSLARVLNSPEETLVEAAARLVEDKKQLSKTLQASRERLLLQEAAGWEEEASEGRSWKVVAREVADVTAGELRRVALALTETPSRIVLLGARDPDRAHLIFARSDDVEVDAAALLEGALTALDGRGGGSARIAQGGGPRVEGLAKALEAAREKLLSSRSSR